MNYKMLLILLFSISSTAIYGQQKKKEDKPVKVPGEAGFEMKQYYFVMLKNGPKRQQVSDSATVAKLQSGHLANIQRLADMGKIVVAGPFGDNGNWRGIFIFDCKTEEEVMDLLKEDPAIAAGRLAYEIHPWWTSKNCVFK